MLLSAEDEIKTAYDGFVADLRKANPGFEGVVAAEASIKRVMTTINNAGFEMNGRCVGKDGDSMSW